MVEATAENRLYLPAPAGRGSHFSARALDFLPVVNGHLVPPSRISGPVSCVLNAHARERRVGHGVSKRLEPCSQRALAAFEVLEVRPDEGSHQVVADRTAGPISPVAQVFAGLPQRRAQGSVAPTVSTAVAASDTLGTTASAVLPLAGEVR